MIKDNNVLYEPRRFNTIKACEDVTEDQWADPNWQLRNAIRSIEQ